MVRIRASDLAVPLLHVEGFGDRGEHLQVRADRAEFRAHCVDRDVGGSKRHTHTTREVQAEGIVIVEALTQAMPELWGRFHPTQTAWTMPSDPQRESVF